jgi:hypothetical protein
MVGRQGVEQEVKRKMYTKALKAQVEHDMYVVDAQLVAEALLRHAIRSHPPRAITRRDARGRVAGDQSPRQQA